MLYRLATVFPPDPGVTRQKHYTMNPGLYEYPFEFKVGAISYCLVFQAKHSQIPFNNTCSSTNTVPNLKLSGLSLEIARAPTRHVKMTLPPTLTTFPGLAEIRYFLKVTVNRKEFYKENPRVVSLSVITDQRSLTIIGITPRHTSRSSPPCPR